MYFLFYLTAFNCDRVLSKIIIKGHSSVLSSLVNDQWVHNSVVMGSDTVYAMCEKITSNVKSTSIRCIVITGPSYLVFVPLASV